MIDENDDGTFPDVNIDPVTGAEFDTFLVIEGLTPGEYTVAVSQFDNFPVGFTLAEGFFRSGEPSFTGDDFGLPGEMFIDVTGDARTNQWAFDILNVNTASEVPEPASAAWLLGIAIAQMLPVRRARRVHIAMD